MSGDNNVICYEGIQRIYRNAMVRFIRSSLCSAYPQNFEVKLHAPFQREWEVIRQHALEVRQSGELDAPLIDDFDLLSVNHFFNLFDAYYDVLCGPKVTGTAQDQKQQKQVFLNWLKTIRNLRDPLSHPSEQDFTREDSFMILDCSRRILNRLGLEDESLKIKTLLDRLFGTQMALESKRDPLEDRLPPRESIVIDFIGRDKELSQLRK